jgi:hypothetical protein
MFLPAMQRTEFRFTMIAIFKIASYWLNVVKLIVAKCTNKFKVGNFFVCEMRTAFSFLFIPEYFIVSFFDKRHDSIVCLVKTGSKKLPIVDFF